MPAANQRTRETSGPIGWQAVRANVAPALILQALMLAVVAGYYASPGFAGALHQLADYKRAHGLLFVIGATVLAGAILPEIFLILFFQARHPRRQNFRNLLFTAPMWAIAGISVDFLYRGLAALLGDTASVAVVAAKIFIDQFVYNIFFAAPYSVLAYHWKNSDFDFGALRRAFSFSFYRDKIIPTLFTNWVVWIPLTAMIYSLPLALQFPLFSLALTFWVLLLTYMTNRFAAESRRSASVHREPTVVTA